MYFKVSRFQRSRRHYAELRGCTIVVYRTQSAHASTSAQVDDVMAVLPVHEYRIDVIDMRDDGSSRIYIKAQRFSDSMGMYIRVQGEARVNAWRRSLGRITSMPLPNLSTLTIESVIGRGGGGKVFVVNWKHDGNTYALKVIDKAHTFKTGKAFRHVASERMLMEKAGWHPFLLQMQFAFQTECNLFIGTPFCRGGDLASYIRHKGDKKYPGTADDVWMTQLAAGGHRKIYGRLSEDQTRLIAAEVILGIEHLHKRGIVYRDLKPENIFIDGTGHIRIGDYGLSKQLAEEGTYHATISSAESSVMSPRSVVAIDEEDGREEGGESGKLVKTMSVCGTRNYLPPEMLNGKLYSYEADIWSLGVMLYRILCGIFPFDGRRTKEVFQRIKKEKLKVPYWLSNEARELLIGILEKKPERRLSIESVKKLAFFESIKWDDVLNKKGSACIPDVEGGSCLQDALENFELSKLAGVTVGEYVSEAPDTNEGEQVQLSSPTSQRSGEKATHRKSPRGMMIGFEYVWVKDDENVEVEPLAIRQKSSGITGLLSPKLSSVEIEQQLPFSPRSPFQGPDK